MTTTKTQTQGTRTTLAHSRVTATISTTDAKRSREFYVNKLGLKELMFEEGAGLLMLGAGDGTSLFCYQRRAPPKAENTVATFEVQNLEDLVSGLRGNGVKFEEYNYPNLKTKNGIAVTGETKGAWIKDPDGNILGLIENISEGTQNPQI